MLDGHQTPRPSSAFVPATVQCFRDGYFVLVVSQEMALTHRITLANIHLAYAPTSCSPTQHMEAFVVFYFPLTHCGTTMQVGAGTTGWGLVPHQKASPSCLFPQVAGDQLIYENWLVSGIHIQKGPQGSITRDSTFQ